MEHMPYQPCHDAGRKIFPTAEAYAAPAPSPAPVTTTDWTSSLPVLHGDRVTLRELRHTDAPSLLALLTTEEVARFISPPPTTLEGFEQFIAWTHRQRAAGQYACFAIVPAGLDVAVGIFQLRTLDATFATAEWGFVMGSPYWGRGLFTDGAAALLEFAFATVGVNRLEARAAVLNGRGNGALRKIGAVCEGTLRQSFRKDGRYLDQHLWSMVASDWQTRDEGHERRPEPEVTRYTTH